MWVDDGDAGVPGQAPLDATAPEPADPTALFPHPDSSGLAQPPGSAPGDEPRRSWVARHKVLVGVGGVVVLLLAVAGIAGGSEREPTAADDTASGQAIDGAVTTEDVADEEDSEAERRAAEEAEAEQKAQEEADAAAQAEADRVAEEKRVAEEAAAAEAAAAEAARIGSVAQQNAYRTATDYLDYMSFSRSGLIGQLEFEGYVTADAEFAIARLEAEGGVDWNAQAAAKAADYLSYTAFSRQGLVDQLLYEGFTAEQAEYGVSTTGL
ncbi:Ltp family lipoprotein [Cellulomonas sp. C5510]|nr:Ltp family lipoprotein [Cellulomonas sp. C5510]